MSAAVSPPSPMDSHWLRHQSRPDSRRRLTAPRPPGGGHALCTFQGDQRTGFTIKRKYAGCCWSTITTLTVLIFHLSLWLGLFSHQKLDRINKCCSAVIMTGLSHYSTRRHARGSCQILLSRHNKAIPSKHLNRIPT